MSTNKTPILNLHSWAGIDKVDYRELNENFNWVEDAIGGSAKYKNGTGTFPTGNTSFTITDAFITANTLVTICPKAEKVGFWIVDSYAGYFTITSDKAETADVAFDWGAIK
jgi:hypothetical protein